MKILVATDGSEYSKAAIEQIGRIVARPEKTEIKVISVYQDLFIAAGETLPIPGGLLHEIADTSKSQAQRYAEEAEKLIREELNGSVKVTHEAVTGSKPAPRILEEAENWAADMIVVGSHGRGFWGRMLGSVSDAVVHHATCTVLIARVKPHQ